MPRAIDRLVPGGKLRDDVAIVAIQNSGIDDELDLHLPCWMKILAEISVVTGDGGFGITAPTTHRPWRSRSLVSEACTNAIEHAYSPALAEFTLRATVDDGRMTFVVTDAGRWREPTCRGQDRGRGLTIIRAAMDDVEVNSSKTGTEIVMRRKVTP